MQLPVSAELAWWLAIPMGVPYGYCPGRGIAAIATGSLHALVGFLEFWLIETRLARTVAESKHSFPS